MINTSNSDIIESMTAFYTGLRHLLCFLWAFILPLAIKTEIYMKAKIDRILDFLKDVAAHNDRGWFAEHKGQYEEARGLFEEMVQALIHRIAVFDGSVAHLTVKDCTYRFYRDTRFSEDKSPYKRHFRSLYQRLRQGSPWHSGYYSTFSPVNACWPVGRGVCLRRF